MKLMAAPRGKRGRKGRRELGQGRVKKRKEGAKSTEREASCGKEIHVVQAVSGSIRP